MVFANAGFLTADRQTTNKLIILVLTPSVYLQKALEIQ